MNRLRTKRLLLSLMVALGSGCGDGREPTYPVSGTVTFRDGSPVRFGSVECRSEASGKIARGVLDRQGRFRLGVYANDDGAVAGFHQVIVVQLARPESVPLAPPADVAEADRAAHAAHGAVPLVSPLYAQYATSPLRIEVKATASNQADLIVDSLAPPRSDPAPRRSGRAE
ncbi:MAG: hypothetical protein KF688_16025 [Pirellulales bacterium]|nr:hypothetical protein [Pirellulales bacterium]